jgi:hypothetical protein
MNTISKSPHYPVNAKSNTENGVFTICRQSDYSLPFMGFIVVVSIKPEYR